MFRSSSIRLAFKEHLSTLGKQSKMWLSKENIWDMLGDRPEMLAMYAIHHLMGKVEEAAKLDIQCRLVYTIKESVQL